MAEPAAPAALTIAHAVREQMLSTVGRLPPEQGGVLGGRDACATRFCFDSSAHTTDHSYIPQTDWLNAVLEEWALDGDEFLALLHSHPLRAPRLSSRDVEYARSILRCNDGMQYVDMLLLLHSGFPHTLVGFRVLRKDIVALEIRYL